MPAPEALTPLGLLLVDELPVPELPEVVELLPLPDVPVAPALPLPAPLPIRAFISTNRSLPLVPVVLELVVPVLLDGALVLLALEPVL